MSPVKSPEHNSGQDVVNMNKIVVEKDEGDELPPGWTKEVKTRKSGSKTKVDRRYTDPVTGYIFRSLKDVQRYLKTGEVGRLAIKPKNNIVAEKEADELPPGWTVEVKRRKQDSGTKVYRRYTDPVTGYIFRSLKDVQRYVKTGEVGRLAIKPKNHVCVATDDKDERLNMEEREESSESNEEMSETLRRKRPLDKTGSEFSETGKSELLHRASKRLAAPSSPPPPEPKTGQDTQLAGVIADTASPLPSEPKTRQAKRLAGVVVDIPSPAPVEFKTCQATHLTEVAVDPSPVEPKTRNATRKDGIGISSPPPSSRDSETCQAKRVSSTRGNASPASLPQPKTRRAARQAGIEINSPPPSLPDTRSGRQATRARLVNLATPNENDKRTEAGKIADKHDEYADMDNDTNYNQEDHENPKGQAPLASIVPPANLEKQEFPMVNPTVSNPNSQLGYGYGAKMESESSTNFSVNDLWTDPCIKFAVKTLTGTIPFEDMNKPEKLSPSPLKVPLEDLWTDPCIEFAVKTLTGAIPVGEDDHLQYQPATSRNTRAPHGLYRPGMSFCQTDVVSKQFETGQNKQQQDSTFVSGQCLRSRLI